MAEPTLQQVFGANASQTSTTITITKADLTGLTASANNTAESLLVGVLLKAGEFLTQANFDANIDQSLTITNGFPTYTFRGEDNVSYKVVQLTVNLAKLDDSSAIDPDDY